MAGAVDVFRRNMIEARTLRDAQEAAKLQTEEEKKTLQRQMADRFEADVKSVVGAVACAGHRGYAARGGEDHRKRQRHLRAGHGSRGRLRGSIGQRQHRRRRDRATRLFRGRDRPPRSTHSSDVADAARDQGRPDHGNGRQPRGRQRENRRRASPDRRDRQPDQFAGAERHHRGGPRWRSRPGICRGRIRSQESRQPDREGHRGDRQSGRRDPVLHRQLRRRDRRASAARSGRSAGSRSRFAAAVEQQGSATREIARSAAGSPPAPAKSPSTSPAPAMPRTSHAYLPIPFSAHPTSSISTPPHCSRASIVSSPACATPPRTFWRN